MIKFLWSKPITFQKTQNINHQEKIQKVIVPGQNTPEKNNTKSVIKLIFKYVRLNFHMQLHIFMSKKIITYNNN